MINLEIDLCTTGTSHTYISLISLAVTVSLPERYMYLTIEASELDLEATMKLYLMYVFYIIIQCTINVDWLTCPQIMVILYYAQQFGPGSEARNYTVNMRHWRGVGLMLARRGPTSGQWPMFTGYGFPVQGRIQSLEKERERGYKLNLVGLLQFAQ